MPKAGKNPILSVRLPPELKATLQRRAEADHRTVTSLVAKIVTDWLRKAGK